VDSEITIINWVMNGKYGEDPMEILDDARRAMEIIGRGFADSESFTPDPVYFVEIFKKGTDMAKPKLKRASEVDCLRKVIVSTCRDIHDISKDIVDFMLDARD